MKRFKFKSIKNTQGTTFLYRLSVYFKNGSLKFHLITGDDSPEYHTHPWDFTSFVLFGGYWEYSKYTWRLQNDTIRVRSVGMGGFNKKNHTEEHRVELFKVFGLKIPTITIGWYSNKLQLCSFCKEAGHCLQSKEH